MMEDKIKELIEHHKLANEEISFTINELLQAKYPEDVRGYMEKLQQEYDLRKVFIGQLNDIV